MWQEPQFDEHAFVKRTRAVSKTTRIAYSDFGSMHVHKRKPVPRRKPIPVWANNDMALREIVLKFCEKYLFIRNPQGTDEERLQAVREKARAMLPSIEAKLQTQLKQYSEHGGGLGRDFGIEVQNSDTTVQVLRRGLPELVTSVAVYSYRLGWDATTVAEELKTPDGKTVLHPPGVRQWLRRLNMIAEGRKEKHYSSRFPKMPWPKEQVQKLFVMRVAGHDLKEIAKVMGVSTSLVGFRWRQEFGDLTVASAKNEALKHRKKYKSNKWPKEVLQRLFVLHAGCGLSFPECAKRMGRKYYQVVSAWYRYFNGLGIKIKPTISSRCTRWTPERLNQLADLRAAGKSWEQCCKVLCLRHVNTAKAALRRWQAKSAD